MEPEKKIKIRNILFYCILVQLVTVIVIVSSLFILTLMNIFYPVQLLCDLLLVLINLFIIITGIDYFLKNSIENEFKRRIQEVNENRRNQRKLMIKKLDEQNQEFEIEMRGPDPKHAKLQELISNTDKEEFIYYVYSNDSRKIHKTNFVAKNWDDFDRLFKYPHYKPGEYTALKLEIGTSRIVDLFITKIRPSGLGEILGSLEYNYEKDEWGSDDIEEQENDD